MALLALVSVLLPACFTMPLHTTARTLPAGKVEVVAAPILGAMPADVKCRGPCVDAPYLSWAPWAGAAVRYGVRDGFELGARVSWGVMLDGKLRLLDGERIALALGLGVGVRPGLTSLTLAYGATVAEVPLLVELGRREGWRLGLALKYSAAFEPAVDLRRYDGTRFVTEGTQRNVPNGPGLELSLDSAGTGWGLRPFVFASLARRTVLRSPEADIGGVFKFEAAGGGVAVTWR